jgi:hypothetical protein
MFHTAVSSFTPRHLKFRSNYPTATLDERPPLDLNDMGGSRPFMVHQQFTEKLLELVDTICSNGNNEVTLARKKLVLEIQEHQQYLDNLLNYEWLCCRAETTAREKAGVSLPITVNTGMSHLVQALCLLNLRPDHLYGGLDTLANAALPLLLSVLGASVLYVLAGLSQQHTNFLLLTLQAIIVSIFGKTINSFLCKMGGCQGL